MSKHQVISGSLRAGHHIVYASTPVTILGAPEPHADRFGQPLLKVWARREDTGAEGWITYGHNILVELI